MVIFATEAYLGSLKKPLVATVMSRLKPLIRTERRALSEHGHRLGP